jgi:signal transduction histidine kinase
MPFALALTFLSAEEALEIRSSGVLVLLVLGFAVVAVLLGLGLRGLSRAERETQDALSRAESAEAAQRSRADEMARVLEASQTLALTGEGQVDYLGMLAAITPEQATSFLVRIDDDEGVVIAAHGPLAASLVGMTRRSHGQPAENAAPAPLASYSASGRSVGVPMPIGHFGPVGGELQAALTITIADRDGRAIGHMHILDPIGERVLEPGFVSLAQLVANQITVAMENIGLMAKLRLQLFEGQRMQQQLIQASKLGAVGELAAAVAHEVNNPLTGILGFSELLLAELPADDPRHDEVLVIRDEAVRARSIVKALLEFARPRPPQRIPTSLNDLARTTLDLVRFRAQDASVQIQTTFGELPCLDVDPDALKQVLLNLFNNAIDAMRGGGRLRVSTAQVGEKVRVTVADDGIGMDADTRGRIFTPFFTTRAVTGGGTGLGLSVSRQIVEGHGGTIEVESELGRGAVFTIWLPASWSAFEGTVLVPGAEAARQPANEAGVSAEGQAAPDQPTRSETAA